ncbi:MAG: hypothetical protein AAGA48_34160 [Myxococcota bacterium]
MVKGRKVNRAEVPRLLAEWERSGESMSEWCEARGLNGYSLNAYKGRWRQTTPEFAEVFIADDAALHEGLPHRDAGRRGGRYRVEVEGLVFEVDDDFRADTLQRLLHTLLAAGC